MNLFVRGFDELSTTIVDLAVLFSVYGEVTGLKLCQGKKGKYAIVMMDEVDAAYAIRGLDGDIWEGCRLKVEESKY